MNTHTDYILSLLLIVLAVLFLDPFMYWMSDSLVYILAGVLLVLFAVFGIFVWREHAEDEREELHKMIAGRIGYLVGAGILVVGIVYQTITTQPDPWLVSALVGMVLGKVLGAAYGRRVR